MFPDIILYGDRAQSIILQGWEAKMPDVPINNEAFIQDAQRKARALNLNSCLIWNFQYAVLYAKDENDNFTIVRQWDDTNYIHTREDVRIYRCDWEELLERIIIEINTYFLSGQFTNSQVYDLSESLFSSMIQRNQDIVAERLQQEVARDAVMGAYVDDWWNGIQEEYVRDENNRYRAYAKTIIVNWLNRIVFAHLIKNRQNAALDVNEISSDITPADANEIFNRITERCDFYNIFSPVRYNELLPERSWLDIAHFSIFWGIQEITELPQVVLQNILENTTNITRREINGQFTTPPVLAKILVRLTVRDWTAPILDCCCGTGTIPQQAIHLKRLHIPDQNAIESVWACDKYQFPLQVANISMAQYGVINVANRLFMHNALSLSSGDIIEIINPENGQNMQLNLPYFGAIISNLPFVPFEIIPQDDKDIIAENNLGNDLDERTDLYGYIIIKLHQLLQPNGMVGVITSNSWLGTNTGTRLIEAIRNYFFIRQVHISGCGRWFQNSDVVTTILILSKIEPNAPIPPVYFYKWKQSLASLEQSEALENLLVNSILLEQQEENQATDISRYSVDEITALRQLNISYNAFFHNVDWLLQFRDNIVPINTIFNVFRGSRRGWDPLFYPTAGEHNIENCFIQQVLINARNVSTLVTRADGDAFCCNLSETELRTRGYTGALAWIERFRHQRNLVGRPLPEVLQRRGMQWYEMRPDTIASFFTAMNPDRRLFFCRFDTPAFINQRLIGLNLRNGNGDIELIHALLNSIFTMFYIEASGFGRGLGVLDINKDKISNCYMFNPAHLDRQQRNAIVNAFELLINREILPLDEDLQSQDRLQFEQIVFESYGIIDYLPSVIDSLLSMQRTRATATQD